MITLFIYGLIVGILVAAPVGPIGALCVQRSLNLGFKAGFITGLGSALADGVYGLIITYGVTFISSKLITYQTELQGLVGVILLYLGINQCLKKPENAFEKEKRPLSWRFLTGAFLLSLTNTAVILLFISVFAALGLSHLKLNLASGALFVLSMILGSSLVWLVLSAGVSFILKKHVNSHTLRIINLIFGTTFFILGLAILIKISVFNKGH